MHLNSIRLRVVGSLLLNGEPCTLVRPTESTERIKSLTDGRHGVVGARTYGREHGITLRAPVGGPESEKALAADAVRAPIVVTKRVKTVERRGAGR